MMTAAPLQAREALTAEQIRTFWPEKAVFQRSEIAQILKIEGNCMDDSRLYMHAQISGICAHQENISDRGHS
ncbi:MAG: hypothetical protein K2G86_06015, partial [Prevotella sp.]|nr:hypothetical protein [Prevotella sp.]